MAMPKGSISKNRINLLGERFGILTVLNSAPSRKNRACWLCLCDCQNTVEVSGKELRNGHTKSCGCRSRYWKHGFHKHRFYYTYMGMMKRCYSQNHVGYHNYGKRGITVCEEWRDNIATFLRWCEEQEPIPENYTLDRQDNNQGYSPENCKFSSKSEQQRNSRRYV